MPTKIIDLLKDIADGKDVPKKILYVGDIYEWSENNKFYYCNDISLYRGMIAKGNCLNDTVEIIKEPKKLEKLDIKKLPMTNSTILEIGVKINEIIEKIEELENK